MDLIDKWTTRRRDRSVGGHTIVSPETPGEADAVQLTEMAEKLRREAEAAAGTMSKADQEAYDRRRGRI